MARYVVGIDKLITESHFVDNTDLFLKVKEKAFIQKYGQYREIITAIVDDKTMVVEGDVMLEVLRELKFTTINTFNLGEMTRKEYLTAKLFVTARLPRLNYLAIAEAVDEMVTTERECQMLASKTFINGTDIKRYKDLLKFDWEEFSRKPLNDLPKDLFSDLAME